MCRAAETLASTALQCFTPRDDAMTGERFINDGYGFAARIQNLLQSTLSNVIISGGSVFQHSTPNMSVDVEAGQVFFGNSPVNISAVTKTVNSADSTNPREDIISVNSSGTVNYTAGTAASNPAPPNVPSGEILLAIIRVDANSSSVQNSNISDCRIINTSVQDSQVALDGVAENRVRIIRLEANASLATDQWDGSYADSFSDSNGYYNSIDTSSTTATWSGGIYNNTNLNLLDTFEDGNYTSNPVWTVGSGSFSVTNSVAYAGTYSLSSGGTGDIYTSITPGSGAITYRCYTRVAATDINNRWGIANGDASRYISITMRRDGSPSGRFDTLDQDNGWVSFDGSTGGSPNTWYIYEIVYTSGATSYTARVRNATTEAIIVEVTRTLTNGFTPTRMYCWPNVFSGSGPAYWDNPQHTASAVTSKIIQTVNLGTTFYQPATNINRVYVHASRSDTDTGQALTCDISVDGGSNYLTDQPVGQWINLTSNLGKQLIVKLNLPDASQVTYLNGYCIFFDTA